MFFEVVNSIGQVYHKIILILRELRLIWDLFQSILPDRPLVANFMKERERKTPCNMSAIVEMPTQPIQIYISDRNVGIVNFLYSRGRTIQFRYYLFSCCESFHNNSIVCIFHKFLFYILLVQY